MIDKKLMTAIENKPKTYGMLALQACLLALCAIAQAFLLAFIIDSAFLRHHEPQTLWLPILILLMVFTLRPWLQRGLDRQSKEIALTIKSGLRNRLRRQTAADFGQYSLTKETGFMGTLAVEGIENTDAYYSEFLPHLFLVGISTPLVLIAAFSQDRIAGVLMLVTAPLIPIFMILIGKHTEGIQAKQWLTLRLMNGHLLDVLRGVVTLRLFNKDQSQIEIVSSISDAYRKKTMRVLAMTFISAFALEFTATLSTAVIAVSLGVRLLYGHMDFLPALTLLLLAPEYFQPLRTLGLKFHAALNGKTAAIGLFDPGLGPLDPASTSAETNDSQVLSTLTTIEVTNLQYTYTPDQPALFQPVTFKLNRGGCLALTGPSGVGKSTLLKRLAGLLEGSETMGSTNLDGYSAQERSHWIAYVPQKPRVFKGTVLDNLRFGNPSLALEEVTALSVKTGFDDIVSTLPDGYHTWIGEGARHLSGGETQLLALTRAWLRDTPFILLDEPTSAMDVHTEKALFEAIASLKKDKTLIIAAHRHKILELCDQHLALTPLSLEEQGVSR